MITLYMSETLNYNSILSCVVLGFSHEVQENCALLSYNAVSGGNFLSAFQDNLLVLSLGVDP
jgi:hypothetical protein